MMKWWIEHVKFCSSDIPVWYEPDTPWIYDQVCVIMGYFVMQSITSNMTCIFVLHVDSHTPPQIWVYLPPPCTTYTEVCVCDTRTHARRVVRYATFYTSAWDTYAQDLNSLGFDCSLLYTIQQLFHLPTREFVYIARTHIYGTYTLCITIDSMLAANAGQIPSVSCVLKFVPRNKIVVYFRNHTKYRGSDVNPSKKL